jgi:hypothetical protein
MGFSYATSISSICTSDLPGVTDIYGAGSYGATVE